MSINVIRADTPEEWRAAVALHKEVYCAERRFEDLDDHVDPDSFDKYDRSGQTRRALVLVNDVPAATSRIIVTGLNALPAIDLRPEVTKYVSSDSTVEFSGFCCSRTRGGELGFGAVERHHVTCLLIGAMCAMAQECRAEYAVMGVERSLKKYLLQLGIDLHQVGEPVEYHGIRCICQISIFDDLLPGMFGKKPRGWAIATNNGSLRSLLRSRERKLELVA